MYKIEECGFCCCYNMYSFVGSMDAVAIIEPSIMMKIPKEGYKRSNLERQSKSFVKMIGAIIVLD